MKEGKQTKEISTFDTSYKTIEQLAAEGSKVKVTENQLKVITNKFNEVIKDLGSKNIKVKLHSTSTSMYKGKYQQDEIIKVEKFSDRKNFIY